MVEGPGFRHGSQRLQSREFLHHRAIWLWRTELLGQNASPVYSILGGQQTKHAAVDRDLQEHFHDLVLAQPVIQRASNMGFDLVGPVERRNHRQVDHAARLAVQAGRCRSW